MSAIGPSEIHAALADFSFPASREEILKYLDGKGDEVALVRSLLEDLPPGTYETIEDVDDAVSDSA